ncbi:MAG: hypothetical protein MJ185_02620 [Treponema sp.]|nr:hypothetical protein [Treponema sp.]
MINTIKEFISDNNRFIFPDVPTGKSETVIDFFNQCVSPILPQNSNTIIKWHKLLVKYANDPKSVLLCRLYESRKLNGEWDTRRGMQTKMKDGFTYAFATNFFARIIYTMAYYDFVPEYEDFKKMFTERKFSLFSFMGKTNVEKNKAAFTNSPYNQRFYTQNWYLAHIVAVNDEPFFHFESKNINDIFTAGNQHDWETNKRGFMERYLDYQLSEEDKKIARAHFLRFVDPINYFLVPNSKHISVSKIGENPYLINFMRRRAYEIYGDIYLDFLKAALSDPALISSESISSLGSVHLPNFVYSSSIVSNNTPILPKHNISSEQKKNKKVYIVASAPNNKTFVANSDFYKELAEYQKGPIDKGFSEKLLSYENEYISVICFNHSNKWLGKPKASNIEKMWSIIYKSKKSFSSFPGWLDLSNNLNISITQVSKGKNQGNYGIRIRGMKQKPNEEIIKKILDYIFMKE